MMSAVVLRMFSRSSPTSVSDVFTHECSIGFGTL